MNKQHGYTYIIYKYKQISTFGSYRDARIDHKMTTIKREIEDRLKRRKIKKKDH